MNKLIISISLMLFAFTAQAQMSLGGGLSYNHIFAGLSNFGLDTRVEFSTNDDRASYIGNISFFFPNSIDGVVDAKAFNSTTKPSTIEVADNFKWSIFNATIGYKRYFKGAIDDDFNFYGAISVGLIVAPTTQKITGDYDQTKYSVSLRDFDASIPGRKETLSNFTMAGFLGVEKEMNRDLYLTGEMGLVLPATGFNSQSGATADYDIGGGFRVTLGARFNL